MNAKLHPVLITVALSGNSIARSGTQALINQSLGAQRLALVLDITVQ